MYHWDSLWYYSYITYVLFSYTYLHPMGVKGWKLWASRERLEAGLGDLEACGGLLRELQEHCHSLPLYNLESPSLLGAMGHRTWWVLEHHSCRIVWILPHLFVRHSCKLWKHVAHMDFVVLSFTILVSIAWQLIRLFNIAFRVMYSMYLMLWMCIWAVSARAFWEETFLLQFWSEGKAFVVLLIWEFQTENDFGCRIKWAEIWVEDRQPLKV